jgi:hypothetical protein
MLEERGRVAVYKDPYSEEGEENRMRGAPVKHEAIPGSLIDKLLNNPHAAIRREPQRWRSSADTEHQKRHAGERFLAVKKTSLTAQQPLLDGGEGELLPCSEDTKLDTHDEQRILPTGENTSSLPPSGLPAVDHDACNLSGLEPPRLDNTGGVVTGADTPKHRIENKHRRQATLANQELKSHWTIYQGEFELPVPPTPLERHWGGNVPVWLGSPSPRSRPPQ